MTSLYLYAVVEAEHPGPNDLVGVGDPAAPVWLVRAERLAGAVSRVPDDLVGRRRDLLAHAAVVEGLLAQGPLLPLRFGTVLPDEQTLRTRVLDDSSGQLRARLDGLAGRVELTVKVWHHEDVVLREVVAEDSAVAAMQARTRHGGSYSDRVRLGELVAAAVSRKQEVDAERVLQRLRPTAVDVRPGPPVDGAVLNAAFLVERERVEEFEQAVEAVRAADDERLTLRLAGPLPPYSFVGDISLEAPEEPPPDRSRRRDTRSRRLSSVGPRRRV